MQRDNDVLKQLNASLQELFKAICYHPRLSFSAVLVLFALATMACAFVNSGSRSVDRLVIRSRLPTLTLTPLPGLTPRLISTPAVVAVSTPLPIPPQAEVKAPVPVPPPVDISSNNDHSALSFTEGQSSDASLLTALVKLNIRSGPGLDYPVVGQLVQGQSTQLIGKNPEGSWWQIVYPAESGNLAWVSADAQYSAVSKGEAVQIAQLPPPPLPTAIPTSAPTDQPDAPAADPIQTPLPTTPPTPEPPTPESTPATPVPDITATVQPLPTGSPTIESAATSIPGPPGWAFTGVRLYTDQYIGGMILYGSMINNTGSPQELMSVTGTFFDAQGQMIADAGNSYAYWPGYVIPPGRSMPFQLFVDDVADAAKFNLSIEAEATDETPQQDIQFTDVNQWIEDDSYCVGGRVQRLDDDLEEYLIIAAVLYDHQNNIVNFSDYGEFGEDVREDEPTFEICIDPPNEEVARHELQAWGR